MTTLDVFIGATGEAERKDISIRVTDARGVLLKRFENDIAERLQNYIAAQTRLREGGNDAEVVAQLEANTAGAVTRFQGLIAAIPK